jgi:hypothetical protein
MTVEGQSTVLPRIENIPGQLTALQFKIQTQGLGPAIN